MIRVLVADDHAVVRTALITLLAAEPDITVVADCGSGAAVVELALASACDVALLDVDMPGTDGITAAERLHAVAPDVGVVMLTALRRPGHLRRALAAGAHGFVTKNLPAAELAHAVRRVHAGGMQIDPQLAAEAVSAGACPLTPRQRQALRLAADGRSVAELAQALGVRPSSARNLLSAAVGGLEVATVVAALRRARDAGWL